MPDLSRVQTRFMNEHRDTIVTHKIMLKLVVCKPCHQQIVIYFGGINLTFIFAKVRNYLVTMDPSFWTSIPFNVPWLLTHFACDNIYINDSNLDGVNITHAKCWTNEFETINKPKPSYRFHRWCPSRSFHRRYNSFFFKWQDEDDNKEGWTILKKPPPWPVT